MPHRYSLLPKENKKWNEKKRPIEKDRLKKTVMILETDARSLATFKPSCGFESSHCEDIYNVHDHLPSIQH